MNDQAPVLVMEAVGKVYRRRAATSWRELLTAGKTGTSRHPVLHGVDLAVRPGEVVGLVGRNGGGKSTLLRLAAGLSRPTSGRVVRTAPVSGLLTLGGTESGELSGADNAVTAAVLAGLSPAQARARLPQIAAFAELEDAMQDPVRTYSDGMRVRLAFAAAVLADPALLLVDEVLAVGDLAFQEKCLSHVETLRDQGCAVLVASHVLEHLRRLCTSVVWLREGRVHQQGPPDEVLPTYARASEDGAGSVRELRGGGFRRGSGTWQVSGARLLDDAGRAVAQVPQGAAVRVALDIEAPPAEDGHPRGAQVSVALRRAGTTEPVVDLTSDRDGLVLRSPSGRAQVELRLDRLDLQPGLYWVDHGLYPLDWEGVYDYRWDCLPLVVTGERGSGPLQPPHLWRVSEPSDSEPAPTAPRSTWPRGGAG